MMVIEVIEATSIAKWVLPTACFKPNNLFNSQSEYIRPH